MTSIPGRILNPRIWAKATRQSPDIQRAANKLSHARHVDPNSWATLAREAVFYRTLNEPALANMFATLSTIAKRRHRVVGASQGDSPARSYNMASQWTIDNRTFSSMVLKHGPTVIEHPYTPTNLAKTHTLYYDESAKRILFLIGPPTHWPSAVARHTSPATS